MRQSEGQIRPLSKERRPWGRSTVKTMYYSMMQAMLDGLHDTATLLGRCR